MSSLSGKTVILGVTGGIAAYKTPELVRLMKKAGADVHVVMTPAASRFVTPLVLGTVSEHPVLESVFPESKEGSWTVHVHLARSADAMLIAPATANSIAKLTTGMADTMLHALYLSLPLHVPVFVSPAMDSDMWIHPATQDNLKTLAGRGNYIIPPATGSLASGLTGPGRMPEPQELVQILENHFNQSGILSGKKLLISAGPTREAIDPVRFISNHSSGKMGFSLAAEAVKMGATVILVSGPVHLPDPEGVTTIRVETALEMEQALQNSFPSVDWVIMAAAVADYRVQDPASDKIKRESSTEMTLNLIPNPDIIRGLSGKKTHQKLIGFALETSHGPENARKKLASKNLDGIILNDPTKPGEGFNTDTNRVTMISKNGQMVETGLASKQQIAREILTWCNGIG